ncbi:hypothetical protein PC113_g15532 [Phytophthora cactorum]|uniref:Uncharacterized protein n=1 Tax=Phytophthora cactorum TaxID=29920 RepID=A0A8T0YNC0_9STRA|nr:hypothetical protein PC113_g15532 [Phytophthora cactorum]
MRDLDCLDIENASKANQASETPTESPQPEQDQPEWQARSTAMSFEISSNDLERNSDYREQQRIGDGRRVILAPASQPHLALQVDAET